MKIVTEEQIKKALDEAGIKVEENCFYELSSSGFGKVLNLERFRVKILCHKVDSETRVSWVCGSVKINKKTLSYVDRYTGCTQWVVASKDLVKAIWMECNKYTIIDALRQSKDFNLYKELGERIKGLA